MPKIDFDDLLPIDLFAPSVGGYGAMAALADMRKHWEDHVSQGEAAARIVREDITDCILELSFILDHAMNVLGEDSEAALEDIVATIIQRGDLQ